jgi:hypothetical protein
MRIAAILISASATLSAWNSVGHKAVAGLAYDLLDDKARARVDELIRRHPDFAMLAEGGPAPERAKLRYAFMKAAFWPDIVKGDPRFYDDGKRDAVPTETKPGFPDMKQHRDWHYINVPFSTDGTETVAPHETNVLSQIRFIRPLLAARPSPGSPNDPVYLLPWFLHLVGDVHQPLHCATRFKKDQLNLQTGKPWSDLGGNTVNVVGAFNLHAYWDDSLGITDTHQFVNGVVKVMASRGLDAKIGLDPAQWVSEGLELAKSVVYSFGNEGGSKENPVNLSDDYRSRSSRIALERAAVGARRLAAILNAELGN